MAIITQIKLDTLNKNEFIQPSVKVEIVDSDSTNTASGGNVRYEVLFCNYKFRSDTLSINIDYPYSSQSLKHIIYGNSVTTIMKEFYDNEKTLKISLNETLKNELYVKTWTIRFILDHPFTSVDKFLYGEAEIQTDPYYIQDSNFINGFLKKRLYIRYLFKLKK